MSSSEKRQAFIRALVQSELSRAQQFIGLVWFDSSSDFCDLEPSAIFDDLERFGMPKQNRSRVLEQARTTSQLVKGHKKGTIRLAARKAADLAGIYGAIAGSQRAPRISSEYLPKSSLPQSRPAWLHLCDELNGCYQVGYYDATAVLARRIVEALLIELYVGAGRAADIKNGPSFFMLDPLITYFESDTTWARRSRDLLPDLKAVKKVGDMAAHHRFHVTQKQDLDGISMSLRRCISELVHHANLH